jgi:WD40 repeat protein
VDGSCCVRAVNVSTGELSETIILEKPILYKKEQEERETSQITCMETHPLIDQYLLVGYDNGDVAIFNILQHYLHKNALVFKANSAITSINWYPRGSFFISGTASGDLYLWQLDQNREKLLNTNASMLYTNPDVSYNNFSNKAMIINLYCLNQNVYAAVKSITDTEKIDGIYNLVFPPNWKEASDIKISDHSINKFILLNVETPHKSDISKTVKYGGIITSSGEFKIIYLQLQNHAGIRVGNFMNEDNFNLEKGEIADITIIKNVKFIERLFGKKVADQRKKSSFPLFGGDIDLSNTSTETSHLIAVKYKDGSANIWAVKSDMGALVKVYGIQNKLKQVKCIKVWSSEAFIVLYDDNSIDFLLTRTLQLLPLSNESRLENKTTTEASVNNENQFPPVINEEEQKPKQYLDPNLTEPIEEMREPNITEDNIQQKPVQSLEENQKANPSPLKSPNNKIITTIAPAQMLNRIVIGYNDGSIDVVSLYSSSMDCVLNYQLSNNTFGKESVVCIDVALVRSEKSNGKSNWMAFAGLSSGRIVGINIEKYDEQMIEWRKNTNIDAASNSLVEAFNCITIQTLDEDLSFFPCVQPSETDLPYFIQQEMSSKSDAEKTSYTSILGINNQSGNSKKQAFVPSNLHLFQINPKLGYVCPLVIEIKLNPETGLRVMNGEVNVRLTSAEGHVAFWAQIHPFKVRVGHLPQNAQSTIDLVEVEFDYDLNNIILDGAKTVVITHDIAQKKYRLYNGSELAGIRTYVEEPPANQSLVDVCITVNGTAPPNKNYSSHEEYVQDYVRELNIYYKRMVSIQKLEASQPDISCIWKKETVKNAGYLICLRSKSIQLFKIKNNHRMKLRCETTIKSTFICGKAGIISGKIEYVTLDDEGIVRIYSIPNLQLKMSKSCKQPHLFRGFPAASLCEAEENHFIFASKEVLIQTCIINSKLSNFFVTEPTFYVDTSMPIRKARQSAPTQVANQVLGGLQHIGNFLFGTNSQEKQPKVTINTNRVFDPKVEEVFVRLPMPGSGSVQQQSNELKRSDYERLEFEKRVVNHNIKMRKLLPFDEAPQIKKQKESTCTHQVIHKATQVETTTHDAKLKRLLDDSSDTGASTSTSRSKLQERTDEVRNTMHENLQKLDERGQKLRNLDQRTADMASAAQSFAAKTALLKKQSKPFGFF